MDRYAKSRLRYNAQRTTGQPEHPGLPCVDGWNGLCRALPGERCTIAPSPCGWLMGAPGRAAHITARLGAQTPGARTTRICRTQATPVVCATPSLTVARPATAFAPMWSTSTVVRPAFVTIAIRPSSLGRVAATDTPFPNFGKVEYFLVVRIDRRFGCFARRATQGLVARMSEATSGILANGRKPRISLRSIRATGTGLC
jgi:hypothetical protein